MTCSSNLVLGKNSLRGRKPWLLFQPCHRWSRGDKVGDNSHDCYFQRCSLVTGDKRLEVTVMLLLPNLVPSKNRKRGSKDKVGTIVMLFQPRFLLLQWTRLEQRGGKPWLYLQPCLQSQESTKLDTIVMTVVSNLVTSNKRQGEEITVMTVTSNLVPSNNRQTLEIIVITVVSNRFHQ